MRSYPSEPKQTPITTHEETIKSAQTTRQQINRNKLREIPNDERVHLRYPRALISGGQARFYLDPPHPRPAAGTGGDLVPARADGLELIHVELLVDDPDLEVDGVGGGEVDPDLVDVEPEQEALHLDPLEVGDGAVAELPRDPAVVVDEVVELDVAGLVQVDGELAVVREVVRPDGAREEAAGEPELGEELVDGGGGAGARVRARAREGRRREGGEEGGEG